MQAKNHRALCALFTLWAGATACQSAAPVDPAQLEMEQARLSAPFQGHRAVLADEVLIELSPNFDAMVSRPAVAKNLHEMQMHKLAECDEYRYRNQGGGLQAPLRFRIGNSDFVALQSAKVRILTGRAQATLRVQATGSISVVESGRDSRQVREYSIDNGAVRAQ